MDAVVFAQATDINMLSSRGARVAAWSGPITSAMRQSRRQASARARDLPLGAATCNTSRSAQEWAVKWEDAVNNPRKPARSCTLRTTLALAVLGVGCNEAVRTNEIACLAYAATAVTVQIVGDQAVVAVTASHAGMTRQCFAIGPGNRTTLAGQSPTHAWS